MHTGQRGSFTEAGRNNLKQRKLGHIMCDNTDITAVPENVFLLEKDINKFIDCDNHDKIKQIDVAELLKFEQTP